MRDFQKRATYTSAKLKGEAEAHMLRTGTLAFPDLFETALAVKTGAHSWRSVHWCSLRLPTLAGAEGAKVGTYPNTLRMVRQGLQSSRVRLVRKELAPELKAQAAGDGACKRWSTGDTVVYYVCKLSHHQPGAKAAALTDEGYPAVLVIGQESGPVTRLATMAFEITAQVVWQEPLPAQLQTPEDVGVATLRLGIDSFLGRFWKDQGGGLAKGVAGFGRRLGSDWWHVAELYKQRARVLPKVLCYVVIACVCPSGGSGCPCVPAGAESGGIIF